MDILPIKDLNDIIYDYKHQLEKSEHEDKFSNTLNNIKNMAIDNRPIFNFLEHLIYYDKNQKKLLMVCCCKNCGNFMRGPKSICKCKCEEN